MKIGIHGKKNDNNLNTSLSIIRTFLDSKLEVYFSSIYHELLNKFENIPEDNTFKKGDDLSFLDVFVTIGGDGTLLDAVTYVGRIGVPILGINTGRLGFLATISKGEVASCIHDLINRKFDCEKRTALKLETDIGLFGNYNVALNDFSILKKDSSSMISVNAYINDELLNSYWADGLIVSTPTGSTGYSLSCGGPLILPHSDSFIITPVSPHNLTVRPIIIPNNSKLKFTVKGRTNKFIVALDSRIESVDDTIELHVMKADFSINLVQIKGNNYFNTLKQKLNWGLDVRNFT